MNQGDIVVIPTCKNLVTHESLPQMQTSNQMTYLLWANDSPLVRYLGAKCTHATFDPVVYKKAAIFNAMQNNEIMHRRSGKSRKQPEDISGNTLVNTSDTISEECSESNESNETTEAKEVVKNDEDKSNTSQATPDGNRMVFY